MVRFDAELFEEIRQYGVEHGGRSVTDIIVEAIETWWTLHRPRRSAKRT